MGKITINVNDNCCRRKMSKLVTCFGWPHVVVESVCLYVIQNVYACVL